MDGISTGARPSVIIRTIKEIYRFHREYHGELNALKRRGG
jgi:hypothetical protein